jgi:hypothetical protein
VADAPPELPDGVLVQSVYANDEGEESGWRVWEDGRHEHRHGGAGWEEGPALDAGAVAALRSALDEAGLEAMAGVHRPETPVRHSGTLRFQAARPDGPVTVTLTGGATLEPLERLTARLLPILSGGRLSP